VLEAGDVQLDPATREVRLKGEPVAMSPREFALLEALLARPGAILSRAQLEDKLYGWADPVESNAVEVHIHALRKKLGAEFIRNVRGVGWMVARSSSA
jgi:two-component system response regulator QseB